MEATELAAKDFSRLLEQAEKLLQSNPSQVASIAQQMLVQAQTPRQRALGLLHWGWAERSLLQLSEGLAHAEEALNIFWQERDLENHTQALILAGGLEVLLGKREASYLRMQEALAQARAIGHKGYEIRACNALGALFDWYSNSALAIEYMLEALRLLEETNQEDSMLGCMVLSNIGAMYYRQGEYHKALNHYQASLVGLEKLGATTHINMVQLNIAESLIKLQRPAKAQTLLESLLVSIRQHQTHQIESFALRTLGAAQVAQKQYQAALTTHQTALEVAERHEWLEEQALAYLGLGQVWLALGQPQQALSALEHAHKGLQDSSLENQLEALTAKVEAFERLGEYQQALQSQREFSQLERQYRETNSQRYTQSLLLRFEVQQTQRQTEVALARNRDLELAIAEKDRLTAELERLSLQDPLTGVYNRRYLDQHFAGLLEVASNQARTIAVVLFDIDHFKQINDRFSHLVGDQVLRQIAQIVLQNLRPSDTVARFGGEEFIILLPDTDATQAQTIAERLRIGLQNHMWHRIHALLTVTASFGIAISQADTPQTLLAQADQALYRAKQQGRNQVVL